MKKIMMLMLALAAVLFAYPAGPWGEGTDYSGQGAMIVDTILLPSRTSTDSIWIIISGDTIYFKHNKGSAFLNLTQFTALFKAGWMLFDQVKPATNDSASSSLGWLDTPYGKAFVCSLFVCGKSPKLIVNGPATLGAYGNDTLWRNKDSTDWYTTINGVKIIQVDANGLTGSGAIRDSAHFTGTCLSDTVVHSSFTATSFVYLSECGATPWTQRLGWTVKACTLFVNTVVGDSAKARASGYKWLKLN